MKPAAYFFSTPGNGPYLTAFVILLVAAFLAAIPASVIVHRKGLSAVRRRARSFRSICRWLVVPGALYLLARYEHTGFFAWRIWLYLIVLVAAVRLASWSLGLRTLANEKVDERNRHRKQLYFKKARRKPRKRRRR